MAQIWHNRNKSVLVVYVTLCFIGAVAQNRTADLLITKRRLGRIATNCRLTLSVTRSSKLSAIVVQHFLPHLTPCVPSPYNPKGRKNLIQFGRLIHKCVVIYALIRLVGFQPVSTGYRFIIEPRKFFLQVKIQNGLITDITCNILINISLSCVRYATSAVVEFEKLTQS